MGSDSLTRRLGRSEGKPIDNDFPSTARIALAYLFVDLHDKGYLVGENEVVRELNRTGRLTKQQSDTHEPKGFVNQMSGRLARLDWTQVCSFCERAYAKLLKAVSWEEVEQGSLVDARQYFTYELNTILEEESLAFHFVDGEFHRRGRAQTQKAFQRAGTVLSNPRLAVVKRHYNKARKFFDQRPNPDLENATKEALCALEAAVEVLTGKTASKDFDKAIKELQGNGPREIPGPIAEGLIRLHGYRGSGRGVAHAALQGNRVWPVDAELVLSLVAAYVTYVVDLFPAEEPLPF